MPVVDLQIVQTPSVSGYSDQYVVELTFEHDDDSITETETVAFPADEIPGVVIEFINVLRKADDYISEHCSEPEDDEVEGYEKWCNYSDPGLHSWPSDSNGNYFARLERIAVAYYDRSGTRFEVKLVENE